MIEIREIGQDGPVADFIDRPPGPLLPKAVSGVSLRLDDFWLHWYLRWYWNRQYWRGSPFPPLGAWGNQRELRTFFGMRYDFAARPDDWGAYCTRKGGGEGTHPVSVVVILRDPIAGPIPESWPRSIAHHRVIYEYRPPAYAQSVRGGDAVRGVASGTLGGYLLNRSDGHHFALSCAHVFGYPLPATGSLRVETSGGGAPIHVGSVVEAVFPSGASGKCNNRIQPRFNSVDAAVADLTGGPSIDITQPSGGRVSQVTPIGQIGPGDPVSFTGATSGRVSAKIKDCNIWKELLVDGQKVCFGDMLELEDVTFNYLASALSKPGDSGAWVISTSSGLASWDAMLVGGDGRTSYCSYAENVMAELDPNLGVPP